MTSFGGDFSTYTLMQLNDLLEDEDKLSKIVEEMQEVREVQQSKQMTLASNRSLAEQNLLLQPRLDCQKNELIKRYCCLQELFEAYQLRRSTLDQKSGINSLDTLLALLQTEGAKIEEETENMADSFLGGDVSLDTFVDEYQRQRKLAHLRRVKIDKLQEMVLKGPRLSRGLPQGPHPEVQPMGGSPALQSKRLPPPAPSPVTVPPDPVALPYPATPYPPIPPRVGLPPPGVPPITCPPSMPFMPQCPPALPPRPGPPFTPQPGFILQ
ncbi:VPS37B subunit of ESCRT-I a [Brienomyrus brachyistius]|uniref:VPS37B subunit of ESCRT-I a n=1 Tax=Brienomyrus brachyistius TaxID=42636 RepID=UPI0020B2A848|nr:VPS37B subunit of ESCRT-I a [Brienomyrus brachyistius]